MTAPDPVRYEDQAQRQIDAAYQLRRQDLRAGLEAYQAAVALLRPMDAPLRLAHTVRHVADIQRKLADYEPAQTNYAEALSIYRSNPATQPLDLANTLRGYALLMESTGNPSQAITLWNEAAQLYQLVGVQAGADESTLRIANLTAT